MKRCCLIALFSLAVLAPAAALTPLPDFTLDGYVATWYEIASIRGFLQSRCARDTRGGRASARQSSPRTWCRSVAP